MGTLGDVKDLAILGALGVGAFLVFKGLKDLSALGESEPEPKGSIDYRGTDLQTGLAGGIQRAIGYGPGWLGIAPSGSAGMRYYGQEAGASENMENTGGGAGLR